MPDTKHSIYFLCNLPLVKKYTNWMHFYKLMHKLNDCVIYIYISLMSYRPFSFINCLIIKQKLNISELLQYNHGHHFYTKNGLKRTLCICNWETASIKIACTFQFLLTLWPFYGFCGIYFIDFMTIHFTIKSCIHFSI